jgi:hypothetical protein
VLCGRDETGYWASGERVYLGAKPEVHLSKGEGKYRTTIGFLDLLLVFEWRGVERIEKHNDGHWVALPTDSALLSKLRWRKRVVFDAARSEWGYTDHDLVSDREPEWVRVDPPAASPEGANLRWTEDGWSYHLPRWAEETRRRVSQSVLVEVKITPESVGDILRQMRVYATYEEHSVAWERMVVATAFPLSDCDLQMMLAAGVSHVRLGGGFEEFCCSREDEGLFTNNSPEL